MAVLRDPNQEGMIGIHSGLKSTEIQKKMPGFDTHIFLLGTPLGSQKCPYVNIPSMAWQENSIFQIYVLKIDDNLQEKEVFCRFKCKWLTKFYK